jgi:hypothetical protein
MLCVFRCYPPRRPCLVRLRNPITNLVLCRRDRPLVFVYEEDPLGKPLCLPIVAVACGWDHPGPGTSRDNVKEEEEKRRAR